MVSYSVNATKLSTDEVGSFDSTFEHSSALDVAKGRNESPER